MLNIVGYTLMAIWQQHMHNPTKTLKLYNNQLDSTET